jgi:hypothetical protein
MTGLVTVANEAGKAGTSDETVDILLKMFVLLYADDTVIFSETVKGLQTGLNSIQEYFDKWKLKLNVSKCKVIVFSRGKIRKLPDLFIGNEKLEVVSEFVYLGLKLNYNNKWHVAQKDLYNRASKAMFVLVKKCNENMLPVDLIIDLIDKTVLPVLTFGCEIWGSEMSDIVLKLQLRFYKFILKLRLSTPSMMVFGETGKYPISVVIKTRMLCFWFKLCNNCENNGKFSNIIYNCLLSLYRQGVHKNKYLCSIELILNELGLSGYWLNQGYAT